MRKAHEAKLRGDGAITVWGTVSPRREFLHVNDCASALVHLMQVYSGDQYVNVGSGDVVTILELVKLITGVVGFDGEVVHDLLKKDVPARKLMSADKIRARGWAPKITLLDGLASAYRPFLAIPGL